MIQEEDGNIHDDIIETPMKEEAILEEKKIDAPKENTSFYPEDLFIIPLSKRPFFPGMAAPILIEKGKFYEVLKIVAKTDHKCMGLFLTKEEEANLYKISVQDLCQVGVVARILRIIPLETGGAQVVLNMEKRISIEKAIEDKYLKARVQYHEDPPLSKLSKELKAYSISIITTIKELLKLNPLFKEELQIFLSHSDFTEPGRLGMQQILTVTIGNTSAMWTMMI